MSFTAVANMVVHDAFAQYFQRALLERSVFFKSGILASDPVIAQKCAEAGFGGNFVSLPFFNALSTSDKEERLDEHDLVPSNVTTGEDVAVIVRRGKAFGANDLATDVAGGDPMKTVADQLADYWNARNERRLFSVLKGVFAKNVSADSSSLVLDITGEEGEKAVLSKDTLLWAAQLLGDHKTDLTAIACNSVVDTYLAAMDTNAGLYRASEGAATLPSYNGRSLIIDDLCGYNAETKVAEIYPFVTLCRPVAATTSCRVRRASATCAATSRASRTSTRTTRMPTVRVAIPRRRWRTPRRGLASTMRRKSAV